MEDFVKTKNGFALNDENECMIAEITYAPYGDDKVIANHTYVDSSLRGQGVAEMLLDRLVAEMRAEGKKIVPRCSYVVAMFDRKREKYADIKAEI